MTRTIYLFDVEEIARVCHTANRALQDSLIEPVSPRWFRLDEETKESARDGVRRALEGLTPEEMHGNWSRFKREHGWVYGDVKDPDEKTHPCLVPYDELPDEQRVKDDLFSNIVKAMTI